MATAQANKTFTDGLAFDANPVNSNFDALRNFANADLMLLDGTKSFSGNLNLGANKVINVGTPTVDGDLANKAYADGIVVLPQNIYTQTAEAAANISGTIYYETVNSTIAATRADMDSVTVTPGVVSGTVPAILNFAETGRYIVWWNVTSNGSSALWGGATLGSKFLVGSFTGLGTNFGGSDSPGTPPPGMANRVSNGSGYQSQSFPSAWAYGMVTVLTTPATISFSWATTQSGGTNYDSQIRVYKIGDI